MAWVRLDDGFPEHPKVVEAGPAAAWLLVRLICYCNRQLTDGYVPKATAHELGSKGSVHRLISVGLIGPNRTGYQIHDYLEYQPSKTIVLSRRQSAKTRMGRVRANNERTSDEVQIPRTQARTQASLDAGTPRKSGLRSVGEATKSFEEVVRSRVLGV